jgi:hypothetical protein
VVGGSRPSLPRLGRAERQRPPGADEHLLVRMAPDCASRRTPRAPSCLPLGPSCARRCRTRGPQGPRALPARQRAARRAPPARERVPPSRGGGARPRACVVVGTPPAAPPDGRARGQVDGHTPVRHKRGSARGGRGNSLLCARAGKRGSMASAGSCASAARDGISAWAVVWGRGRYKLGC